MVISCFGAVLAGASVLPAQAAEYVIDTKVPTHLFSFALST